MTPTREQVLAMAVAPDGAQEAGTRTSPRE